MEKETYWQDARWELEPCSALAQKWADDGHSSASWLLQKTGEKWHELNVWFQVEPLYRRALSVEKQRFGSGHPNVALSLHNLARFLQEMNRLAEAESLYRRAITIMMRHGNNDGTVASALCYFIAR